MPAKLGDRVLDHLVVTRLDEQDAQRLEEFSKRRRLKKGTIIRLALREYITQKPAA